MKLPPRTGRYGLIALVALGILWMVVRSVLGPAVPVARARRQAFVQTVLASGQIEPLVTARLGSQIPGRVKQVLVQEGEQVKAGQLLVWLDDDEARNHMKSAEAAVEGAEARLGQIRQVTSRQASEEMRQGELKLEKAQEDLLRLEKLAGDGTVSQQDLSDARVAVELARSQLNAAAVRVASQSRVGAEQRIAAAAIAQASASLLAEQARLAQTRLSAPAEGTILVRAVEPGDVVQPGQVLLQLGHGPLRIAAPLEERQLSYLKLGQLAQTRSEAFPGLTFSARIEEIAPAVDARLGVVMVKLAMPAPSSALRSGMTVSVEVELARQADALLIPMESVRDPASAEPWVWVIQNGAAQRRAVRLGAQGQGKAEVQNGLAEGEAVIVDAIANLASGQRVRAQDSHAD